MIRSEGREEQNVKKNLSGLVFFLETCVFCYFISWMSLLFRPKGSYAIESFNRIIGMGVVNDSDITKIISHFYLFLFVLFLSVLFLYKSRFFFLSYLKKRNISELWILSILLILGLINNLLYIFVAFVNSSQIRISANLLLILIVYYSLAFLVKIRKQEVDKIVLLSFGLSSLFFVSTGFKFLAIFIAILSLLTVFFRSLNTSFYEKINIELVVTSSFPLLLFALIEAIHILPQYGLFVTQPLILFWILSLITLLIGWLADGYFSVKKTPIFGSCLLLLTGYALLSCQQGFYINVNADIFETANSSVLISDFLNHGVIPIVGHYGGHMLSGVLEGVGYAWLTGDHYGAIFSPYSGYMLWPVWAICFFLLMKIVLRDEIGALISALCFPFISSLAIFFLGLIVCFSTIAFVRRPNKTNSVLLWASWVFCALYRLDLGFAFILASVGAVSLIYLQRKDFNLLRYFFFSGAIFLVLGILIWLSACLHEGVDPILRFKEFIAISASNRNWAYGYIGNPQLMAYSWCYLIVPALVTCSLAWLIVSKKIGRELGRTDIIVLLLVLGLSYLANYTRGLVRHSLVEMAVPFIIWSAYLYLALVVSFISKKRILVLPTLLLFFVLNGLIISNSTFSSPSLLQTYLSNSINLTDSWRKIENNGKNFWTNLKNGTYGLNRIQVNTELQRTISEFNSFLTEFLEPNETYLDFMNKSFLYSATNRLNPVYAAQSPIHLSGEFAQEMYLKEIEKKIKKVPFAIFSRNDLAIGTKLDGVDHVIRYYKIAEYIYQNYQPLLSFGNYAVWVQKNRYAEYRKKLQKVLVSDNVQKKSGSHLINHCQCINASCSRIGGNLLMVSNNSDPQAVGIQQIFDLNKYIDRYITITLDYESSVAGEIQLFFTDKEGEKFSEGNSLRAHASNKGIVSFNIPVKITKFTKFRLDPPANSNFEIKELSVRQTPYLQDLQSIDYGYDFSNPLFHNYLLNHLPRLWGELDIKKAKENEIEASLKENNGIYKLPLISDTDKKNGNYLRLDLEADKNGPKDGGEIEFYSKDMQKLYSFKFTIMNGSKTYLFRVSSDYYWYSSQPVFLKIKSLTKFNIKKIDLLKGD